MKEAEQAYRFYSGLVGEIVNKAIGDLNSLKYDPAKIVANYTSLLHDVFDEVPNGHDYVNLAEKLICLASAAPYVRADGCTMCEPHQVVLLVL